MLYGVCCSARVLLACAVRVCAHLIPFHRDDILIAWPDASDQPLESVGVVVRAVHDGNATLRDGERRVGRRAGRAGRRRRRERQVGRQRLVWARQAGPHGELIVTTALSLAGAVAEVEAERVAEVLGLGVGHQGYLPLRIAAVSGDAVIVVTCAVTFLSVLYICKVDER